MSDERITVLDEAAKAHYDSLDPLPTSEFLSFKELHEYYLMASDGVKQAEIADELGVTLRTVRRMKAGNPTHAHLMIDWIELTWPTGDDPEIERGTDEKPVVYYKLNWRGRE